MPSTPSRPTDLRLRDILENIKLARTFVAGFSFKDFQSDRRTFYAVIRCLEIISEASRHLPPEIKARHEELDWIDIAGAGNIYRHVYHAISDEIIWQTVQQDLEPLRVVVEQELERLRT
jgi:uncharacterized protein with HEPN domain